MPRRRRFIAGFLDASVKPDDPMQSTVRTRRPAFGRLPLGNTVFIAKLGHPLGLRRLTLPDMAVRDALASEGIDRYRALAQRACPRELQFTKQVFTRHALLRPPNMTACRLLPRHNAGASRPDRLIISHPPHCGRGRKTGLARPTHSATDGPVPQDRTL